MAVTFVNLFEVPEGRDGAFLELWQEVNTYMRAKPGYSSHRLHRAIQPGVLYRYFNIALWKSEEHWAAAHDDGFRALVSQPAWKEFPPLPTLYEVVHEGQAGAEHDGG